MPYYAYLGVWFKIIQFGMFNGIEIPMAAMSMGHLESTSPAEFLLGGWLPCDWGNVADVACSTQILGEHRHGQTVTNLFGSYCSLKRFATFKDFKPWKPCPRKIPNL